MPTVSFLRFLLTSVFVLLATSAIGAHASADAHQQHDYAAQQVLPNTHEQNQNQNHDMASGKMAAASSSAQQSLNGTIPPSFVPSFLTHQL
ncbi:hypothetical protein BKA81DRAFT_360935 [Phyllosticta paracitricarpa]